MNTATVLCMHCDAPTHARLRAFLAEGGTVSDSPESYGWSLALRAPDGRLTGCFVPDAGEDPWDVKVSGRVNRALDRLDALLAGGWSPRPGMSEWECSHLPGDKRPTSQEAEAEWLVKHGFPADLGASR